jgi:sec-independent protein translocase protein TatA
MFGLGFPELIIILIIVVMIFGVGKLPEVGGAIGKGIRSFKRASKEPDKDDSTLPKEGRKQDNPPQ